MQWKRHARSLNRVDALEPLEPRVLLSRSATLPDTGDYHPLIVAGSLTGSPPDSSALRVDPNTTTSPFAGVGSLLMVTKKGMGICTATPIGLRYILTAAHCIDLNDDGRATKRDGLQSVTFNLNYGSDLSHQIPVSSWQTHPDYSGFNRPSVNDDLAILTLSAPLPLGVPFYTVYTGAMDRKIILVGYGRSGDGETGFYVDASMTVKRRGENYPDSFGGQDDFFRPSGNETFVYDFDGPVGNGPLGNSTLGNTHEGVAGPGDSGGPSFVLIGPNEASPLSYAIAGVNTFTLDNGSIHAPLFGSMAGGVLLANYESWILTVLSGKKFVPGGSGGGSGGLVGRGGGSGFRAPGMFHTPLVDFQSNSTTSTAKVDLASDHQTEHAEPTETLVLPVPTLTASDAQASSTTEVPSFTIKPGALSPIELHDMAIDGLFGE
jgi:hypothetical protein